MGYSPWGCKESDTEERPRFTFFGFILLCLVLSPYLVYLRNLPHVRERLSAKMDSGEAAYG